jgi:predicted Zn-dependent peptidase
MEIVQEELKNGLTVIVVPMQGLRTITELFITRAGWKYETRKELRGISHFLEHVIFKGTRKRPTTMDITKEIDSKGGILNAFTENEYTGYYLRISSRFLSLAHDLISDMLLHSKFEQKELDLEKGTIIEEIRMYNDDPALYVVGVAWSKILYGDQPAGQSGLGTEETVSNFTRKQVIDYLRKLYVAQNAAVCVAGNITDCQAVVRDIERYFGEISSSPPGILKPPVKEEQGLPQVLIHDKSVDQSHICLGVRAYNIHHQDRFSLELLRVILGGNTSSRMFTQIRERRGWAYYVRTLKECQTDVGSLFTHAGLKQEKIIEALKIIIDQYREVAGGGVSQEELQLAKDYIRGQKEIYGESPERVAFDGAQQFALTGRVMSDEEELERIEAVTLQDIERVAQDIFRDENLNLAIVGPHQKEEEELYQLLRF